MNYSTINDDTPLVMLTAGQLKALFGELATGNGDSQRAPGETAQPRRLVYGLKGIMDLFDCSNVTAQKLKNGVIAPAVHQTGRKIVTDADLALQLFNERKK